jgi:TonB-linked SusC/RagA family outer membrane protein
MKKFPIPDFPAYGEDKRFFRPLKMAMFVIITFMFIFSSAIYGQQRSGVTGQVTDTEGRPLPGVTVAVKGTTQGTVTDAEGRYSIPDIPNDATLTFSFVGMESQEVVAGNQGIINVSLEESVTMLEETVVTALGIRRDVRALSYSATQVGGEEISSSPEVNIMNSLEGMVAGVFVNNPGTGIAGSSDVTIRGSSSISRGSQPLYVIDGIPISQASSSHRGRDLGDALTMINPNDILSMNILKGAAATALYGSRASNGVIIITTKGGRDQKGVLVTLNSNVSFDNYMNPFQGRQKEYGVSGSMGDNSDLYPLGWNEETHRAWGRRYDGTNLGERGIYFNNDQSKPVIYEYVTDHWDEFMRTGSTVNNSISLAGGNEAQRFRLSVSDLRNESPLPNSNMNRQTLTMSSESKFLSIFTLDARMNFSTSKSLNRPVPGRYAQYLSMIPTNWPTEWLIGDPNKPGALPDGWMLSASTNDYHPNPYWSAYQDRQDDRRDRFSANANLRADLTKWLFLVGKLGFETSTLKNTDISAYGWLRSNVAGTGRIDERTDIFTQENYELSLNIDKAFGKFNINLMGGGSITRNEFTRDGIYGDRLQIPFYHVVTNAGSIYPDMAYSQSGINSLYGSSEFAFNNMLYITLTGRNDWFSMLAPGYNSIFYPSAGLSYVFSNHFNLPEWMTFTKLRASYAQVGGGASPYDTKISYNFDAIGYMDSPLVSIPATISNPFLQPYLTTEYEVGIDLKFFKNRIGIDYSYYDSETTNDIVTVTLPQSSGYTGSRVNLGAIANRGHEIMLTLVPVAGKLRWQLNLSYAYNQSEVLDLGGVDQVSAGSTGAGGGIQLRHVVGEPRNGIYGYVHTTHNGQPIWQRMTFSYAGQTHYTWRPVRSSTVELLGYGINPNDASIRSSLKWKGINLDFMIDGKWGGKTVYATEQNMVERGQSVATLPGRNEGKLVLQGVYQTGTDGQGKPVYADISTAEGYTLNANPAANIPNPVVVAGNEIPYHIKHFEQFYRHYQTNWLPDYVLFDGGWAKLRQASIGLTIPAAKLKNLPVSLVQISVTGRNLLDLYNPLTNGDPSTGRGTGIQNHPLTSMRQFSLNLNINF